MSRTHRPIDLIVIHCAATPNGRPHTAADIRKWHTDPEPKGRGWSDIGYHHVLRIDGGLDLGRPLRRSGAHAAGHNSNSIGICLVGTDRFSPRQWEMLRHLLEDIELDYPAARIVGHRDLPNVHKSCPGFDVAGWLKRGKIPLEENILFPGEVV